MRRVAALSVALGVSSLLWVAPPSSAQPAAPAAADPPCYDNVSRFVDCGNGTVTDGATGIVWLLDADCFFLDYSGANTAAATLGDGQCGLTDGSSPGDWRLATREEWQAILAPSCPAPRIVGNGASGGCYVNAPWASGVQLTYWSSSTDSGNTQGAWGASLSTGTLVGASKAGSRFAWPVRKAR
jgi:hypothetical protein